MTFSGLDWIVLTAYLMAVVGIGVFFAHRQTTSSEFFLGSRRFGAFTVSLSVLATGLSAITFIGIPGLACATDWSLFLSGVVAIPALILVTNRFLPVFYRSGLPSAYDFLEQRFDRRVALLGGTLFLMVRGLLAGIAIYAPSVALCAVTGWDLFTCILIFGVLTLLYTALGGMSAVIWTDVLQVIVLFGGAFLSIGILWSKISLPPREMFDILLAENKFRILDFRWSWFEMTFWTSVIGGFLFNTAFYGTDQVMIQRCLASRSLKTAKNSLILNAWYMVPMLVIFFFLGSLLFLLRHQNPGNLPSELPMDQIFPYFIAHHLPSGVSGLLIAAVLAAAMSTLSAVLNSLATVTMNDFLKKYWTKDLSEARYTILARFATAGWGFVAVALALLADRLGDSVTLAALKAGGLFTGPVLAMFLAGLFIPWMNALAVFWAALVGVIVSLWTGFFSPMDSFWVLGLGCLVTIILAAGGSLVLNAASADS